MAHDNGVKSVFDRIGGGSCRGIDVDHATACARSMRTGIVESRVLNGDTGRDVTVRMTVPPPPDRACSQHFIGEIVIEGFEEGVHMPKAFRTPEGLVLRFRGLSEYKAFLHAVIEAGSSFIDMQADGCRVAVGGGFLTSLET
ncbi:MAG: hypothetical protein H6807_15175 [Planctomycetes bacterium]|nr:hypothetical protein [Planctomycetota bacterium]